MTIFICPECKREYDDLKPYEEGADVVNIIDEGLCCECEDYAKPIT